MISLIHCYNCLSIYNRISIEFKGKNAYLGLFSKIKYLNSNNDQNLRDKFFQYKYERGFVFSSSLFDGNKGKFPVGFLVWNLKKTISLEKQTIILDVYNTDCEKVGTKEILTTSRDTFLNKWVPRYRNTHVLPPFSSAISISDRTKDVRNKVADGFLCSMMCCGNDMQHQNYVCLLSGPQASAGSFSVVSDNFERAMVVHAVRRIPKATWINDRDQFYQPFTDDLPQEFVNDCVIWSAFAPSNNTASLKDVAYQGKVYQIENQLFPFLLSDVVTWKCSLSDIRTQLFSANEDRFMAKWIDKALLSKEANAVLSAARQLYQSVYEHIASIRWLEYKIELWDIGWWQVKEAAKKIDQAQPLYNALKQAVAVLSAKIESQIGELGFMAPEEKPLD